MDESGFAACIFSDVQLMFIRMNGNHVYPRLQEFVRRECERAEVTIEKAQAYVRAHQSFAREVAQTYIADWFNSNETWTEAEFIQKIAQFLRVNRSLG